MPTAIKMWEIAENSLRPIADVALPENHLETDLEGWIAADSQIIGHRILMIDRQRDIPGVGRLDLLGIDSEGTLIIIELKRDRTPREAVAQALDYASWIDSANETEIIAYATEYLKRPLEEAFRDYFQDEMPELSCQRHRITLVAPRLDASAERIITYLSERHRVDINAVFFQYARLSDGREVMARTMLVAEESRPPSRTRRGKPSIDSLIAIANEHGTSELVNVCRELRDIWDEDSSPVYGGSFQFLGTNAAGQTRVVFGINIAGQPQKSPPGHLDVWIPVKSLAEITGRSEEDVRTSLREQPVVGRGLMELWIRLTTVEQATTLVDVFRKLYNHASKAV
jgi:hypothetical protein